jgi:putative two-component system response regulator
MRVLIIDPLRSDLALMTMFVGLLGHHTSRAYLDADAALAQANTSRFDLTIVDHKMPWLDSLDFLRRLRTLPHCADLPVVVTSIADRRSVAQAALAAGAAAFIPKPIDRVTFLARVRQLLEEHGLDPVGSRLDWPGRSHLQPQLTHASAYC